VTTTLAYLPSPAQGVWHLGPIPIRAYAFCIIVGIVVALVLGDRRWQNRGGEAGVIYDIALWAVPFGLLGGRLYHVLTDWQKYFGEDGAGISGAVRIWEGGLGIWGAVALGGVGAWIACKQRGIPLPAFGDAIAPGIILAQAIGRLGNYFNQELFGRQTDLPWGLEIYQRVPDDLNGVSNGVLVQIVHPTFLYELLWNVAVFAVLIYVDRRFQIGHGRLFALYVAGYCTGRFFIELLRSDFATEFAGIRVNSFTSGFVWLAAMIYFIAAPKGREDPATLRGKGADDEDADSEVGELVKVAGGVAATTGVVAAAKVAGRGDDATDDKPEAVVEAEALTADVAEAPAEDIAEADEFAAAGDVANEDAAEFGDEAEPVAVAQAEALAVEVAEAPAEDIEVAQEFAAAGDAADQVAAESEPSADADAAAVGGVGVVEGEDAVAAAESAEQVHDAAVEGAEEAEDAAAEVAAEPESEAVESEPSADADAAAVGGVGVVEGEDAVAAAESAEQVHDAAVEGAEEAEDAAGEVAAEPESEAVESEPSADADAATAGDEPVGENPAAAAQPEDLTAADADADASDAPATPATPAVPSVAPGRRRWWRRGR
jgi:prolipoprotein diacylglyceryl transferase